MPTSTYVFPPHKRRLTLVEIDAAIEQAAENRMQQLAIVEHFVKAGKDPARIAVWLRRTDDHLDGLRLRRHTLLCDRVVDR